VHVSAAVAVDGKTVRGAVDAEGAQVKLFSMVDHATGVPLGQVQTVAGDEIASFATVLDRIDLTGTVVTADALHTWPHGSAHRAACIPTDRYVYSKGCWRWIVSEAQRVSRKQQGEHTRQQIVEAATKLFAQKGYRATSMADLTTSTGLTRGALYHHFDAKDTLFRAVVDHVRTTWGATVGAQISGSDDALEQLASLIGGHARLIRDRPELCLVITGLSEEIRRSEPELAAALHGVYRELIAVVQQLLTAGQGAGQVRADIDPHLVAIDIIGLLRGISCFGVLADLGLDVEQTLAGVRPVLIDGLKPRPSGVVITRTTDS
jgi:AcrR family transcriptional regulator